MYDESQASVMIESTKSLLYMLFVEYNDIYETSSTVALRNQTPRVNTKTTTFDFGNDNLDVTFFEEYEQNADERAVDNRSEVDQYLSDVCESRTQDFDILTWWKVNESKYPILAMVARDVLAIPVSTVSSESAFSTGGRVLDPFRSSLASRTVESLVCAQNWLRSDPIQIDLRETLNNVKSSEVEPDQNSTPTDVDEEDE